MSNFAYRLAGTNGHGVMLIHGLTGAPAEMRFLAKRLNRAGYTVDVPQLAGHCADEVALLKTSWRDWYGSVAAAYRAFKSEVKSVCAAGICAGGALSLKLASEHPELAAVGVYSMTYNYDGWNMSKIAAAAPLLSLVANWPYVRRIRFEEPFPFGLKDKRLRDRMIKSPDNYIEGALNAMPMQSLNELYQLGRHISKIASNIRTPALIVHAREDDMSSPRNATRLAGELGGPASLHILDDSYHMIHVDQERDRVASLTADFFGQQHVAAATAPANIVPMKREIA